uniref:Glycine rich superfamily member n=1 Tax=Rhipicephalus appendiculatus TaxID=34631 RepID=A0A131YFF7_RHIAP
MVKRLVLLNTLVILLAAAKANEENNESEEDILEAIGSAAATLGHHVHRFFSAFVRGIEKEIAQRRRIHAEKEEASKGAAPILPSKVGTLGEPSMPGGSQEGSSKAAPAPQEPQKPPEGLPLPSGPP